MPSSCQFAVVDTATASFWKKSSAPSASMNVLAAIRRVEHELPLRMDLLGMRLAGAELVGRDDVFLLLNGLEIDLEARLQRCRILLVVVRRFLLGALETAGENGFRGSLAALRLLTLQHAAQDRLCRPFLRSLDDHDAVLRLAAAAVRGRIVVRQDGDTAGIVLRIRVTVRDAGRSRKAARDQARRHIQPTLRESLIEALLVGRIVVLEAAVRIQLQVGTGLQCREPFVDSVGSALRGRGRTRFLEIARLFALQCGRRLGGRGTTIPVCRHIIAGFERPVVVEQNMERFLGSRRSRPRDLDITCLSGGHVDRQAIAADRDRGHVRG